MYLLLFFYFVLGAIIGSFLNVLALRYNSGFGIAGRSMCMSCARKLSWFDLIPIFSFFIQKGKCRTCKSYISRQYPLVEALTGLLFAALFLQNFPPLSFFYAAGVFCLLIIILIYDYHHKIIPDVPVWIFIALSFAGLFFNFNSFSLVLPSISALIAGPVMFTPFYLLWLVSSGRWMGFGDAKLALGIGWFLGLSGGASAIMLSFWIGTVWALSAIAAQKIVKNRLSLSGKTLTIKSEVPFAPFMVIAVFLVFLFGFDFLMLNAFL